MQTILDTLGSGFYLLLVVLGFSLIIFLHELGHFVAARWAGIRVLAFAIGFGPALFSYRKGLGLRRGSSAPEVEKIAQERGLMRPGRPSLVPGISPTEYRLNAVLFGGYVKMLGQEDADPTARSDEPDGYQSAPPWKRMVVISAGVVANFLVAALLFVAVFMLGLKTEPAIVGAVLPGSPAATSVPVNAKALGITDPGLKPGDRLLSLNGDAPDDFNEVIVSVAMARRERPIRIDVERAGYPQPLVFEVTPRMDPASNLLQIGVGPIVSDQVASAPENRDIQGQIKADLKRLGLAQVEPGMTLVRVGDKVKGVTPYDIEATAATSGGKPFEIAFAGSAAQDSGSVSAMVTPRRDLPRQEFWPAPNRKALVSHVLGLLPVMSVDEASKGSPAEKAGLRAGDVFVQIGSVEWPSVPEGIAEISASAGGKVHVVVRRGVGADAKDVDLGDVPVGADGRIGFASGEALDTSALVTVWPRNLLTENPDDALPPDPPSVSLALMRGSRILSVNGKNVASLEDLASRLIDETAAAYQAGDPAAKVTLAVELPLKENGNPAVERGVEWTIPRAGLEALHKIGWTSPISIAIFEPEKIVLQASGPVDAIGMGLRRTHRVMIQTYLTFSRLFQGSVKVEQLKGPVGIAHVGTVVARNGFVPLMFFLALLSVNLGVVNFLPIPIADGGHFVFLLYEQITGKPVSVVVQNVATLAGLILIAGMFLLVTYNDIATLFRG